MNWNNPKNIYYLQKTISLSLKNVQDYDYVFYFPPLEPKEDGKRIHTSMKQIQEIDEFIRSFMVIHKIEYNELDDLPENRVNQILEILVI